MSREYFLEDALHPNGGFTIKVKNDHDCVFCKHCTDIWWDYSNLIYMAGASWARMEKRGRTKNILARNLRRWRNDG